MIVHCTPLHHPPTFRWARIPLGDDISDRFSQSNLQPLNPVKNKHHLLWSWLVNLPPLTYPPKNKGLTRPQKGKPMVNKPLIRPHFLGGYVRGGVGWPAIIWTAKTFVPPKNICRSRPLCGPTQGMSCVEAAVPNGSKTQPRKKTPTFQYTGCLIGSFIRRFIIKLGRL